MNELTAGAGGQHAPREPWIDTARSLMIFAIVWGHVLGHTEADRLYAWLYNFHVPMGLMISGMVITYRQGGFIAFMKKRFFRMMVPYYCFSLVSIAIYVVLGSIAESSTGGGTPLSLSECLLGMLWANSKTGLMRWNSPYWYIPVSFAMSVPAFWAAREKRVGYVLGQFAVSVAAALLVYSTGPAVKLPFALETVVCSFPLLLLGRLLRMGYGRFRQLGECAKFAVSALLVTAGTLLWTQNTRVTVGGDIYGNYFIFLPSAGMTAAGFILLASLRESGVRPLCYVGRNTLGVLLMHKFPVMFVVVMLPFARDLLVSWPVVMSVALSVVTIILCLAVGRVICLAAPWALGEPAKK